MIVSWAVRLDQSDKPTRRNIRKGKYSWLGQTAAELDSSGQLRALVQTIDHLNRTGTEPESVQQRPEYQAGRALSPCCCRYGEQFVNARDTTDNIQGRKRKQRVPFDRKCGRSRMTCCALADQSR